MTLALLLLLQAAAPAAEADRLFETGARLIAEGDTAGAVAAWEGIAEQGVASAAIEHNLGTLALERGDVGRARLHLERAARLDASRPGVAHNLRLARQAAGVGDRPVWRVAWDRLGAVVPPGGLVALALALSFAALGVVLLERRRLGAALGALALVTVVAASAALWERTAPVAIVVASEADLREAPSAAARGVARVRAGEVVALGDAEAGWRRVEADGVEGWVPEAAVERL
ncbi:MAG: SH3 domain-containing protein [Bacteroidota bacterium]